MLGVAELTILDFLRRSMRRDDIVRQLLRGGKVNAAAAGSEAVNSLVRKNMARKNGAKVELTPAGKLLRRALVQARQV